MGTDTGVGWNLFIAVPAEFFPLLRLDGYGRFYEEPGDGHYNSGEKENVGERQACESHEKSENKNNHA